MNYYGTIKGKEKELANLRKLVTQNKDVFFDVDNTIFGYKYFMRDLMLDQNQILSENERKINIYLNKIFLDEKDLFEKIYLIIPDEPDLLINLFPDDYFKNELLDSVDIASDQLLFKSIRSSWAEKLLIKLIEYKLSNQNVDEKLKWIRNYVFNNDKNNVILSSKDDFDIIKQIFQSDLKDEYGDKLIDTLLINFYIFTVGYYKYLENKEKYLLSSDGNKIQLKDFNFSLTKRNGFKELNFILDVQRIGLIKFDLNSSPIYSLIENRNFKI